jgi:hypothetical protein
MASEPKNPSTTESERIHENQRSAEEGARKPERRAGDVEHAPAGPAPRAEPVEEAPHSEGDRGLDGFR